MNNYKKFEIVLLFILIFTILSSCNTNHASKTCLALGTVCHVNLYEDGSSEKYDYILENLANIEKKMTVNNLLNQTDMISEVEKINLESGKSSVKVSPETFYVIEKAFEYGGKTHGAFEPTIGPLVKLWNIGGELPRVPSQSEIKSALALVSWENIVLNKEEQTVFLKTENMALDLGAIAKGYAADFIVDALEKWNVKRSLIDLGGNIYVHGFRDGNKTPWRVGIKNPFEPEGQPIIRLEVSDTAVVTSGIYERFFQQDGNHYHHIIDSRTGKSAESDVVSATIICKSSMIADILSTATLVMGSENALGFLKKETGVEGIFITKDKNILTTAGLKNKLDLLDLTYKIKQ